MKKTFRRTFAAAAALTMTLSAADLQTLALGSTDRYDGIKILHIEPIGDSENDGVLGYKYFDFNGNQVVFDQDTIIENYPHEDSSSDTGLLPSYFDLRNEGRVTSVKNQGAEGTCWAHSALASVESNMITKGYADNSVDYSEKHLVWFTHGKTINTQDKNDPTWGEEYYGASTGEEDVYKVGAYSFEPKTTLMAWIGAEMESSEPYSSIDTNYRISESKRYSSYSHLENSVIVKSNSSYNIDLIKSDADKIKRALMKYGALSLDYTEDMSSNSFNSATNAYYSGNECSGAGHAVAIVGWDDDYSASNFKQSPPGNGAWIIKNSWGNNWGENGYFYMSYYEQTIGEINAYDVQAADNYDNNYQYSKILYGNIYDPEANYITSANVFTAKGDEILEAVSFYHPPFTSKEKTIIRIYTDSPKGDPTGGELVLTQNASNLCQTMDFVTAKLDKKIPLTKGQRYTVAITTAEGTSVNTDAHCYAEDTSYFSISDTSEPGKMTDCFNYDYNDEKLGNFLIRAYTNNNKGEGTRITQNNFPDISLRNIVSGYDDDKNGLLSDEECQNITSLQLDNKDITTLAGIEYLTYLKNLSCCSNKLKVLDVSGLSYLEELHCDNNMLSSIDLSGTAVKRFTAGGNIYEPGEIRNYFSLYLIDRYGFDDSKLISFEGAEYNSDDRIFTDFDENGELSYEYDCGNGFTASFTVKPSTIQNGLTVNKQNFPDDTFRSYVSQSTDANKDGVLSVDERKSVTEMTLDDMGISDLTGIENFYMLQKLSFADNKVSVYNLRQNPELTELNCDNNNISWLDVNNTKLTKISCRNNCLPFLYSNREIELHAEGNIHTIDYVNDKLYIRDLVSDVNCTFYPGHLITNVKGAKLADNFEYFYDIDGSGTITYDFHNDFNSDFFTFTIKYDITETAIDENNFPDKTFRAYVTENFDTDGNGSLSGQEKHDVTSISVSGTEAVPGNTENLTGVAFFPNLISIQCSYNKIKNLDLSSNTEIKQLYADNNEITTIDIKNCKNMQNIVVNSNKITEIELPEYCSLSSLIINNNPIKSIKLTKYQTIKRLHLNNTTVETIEISGNIDQMLEIKNCASLIKIFIQSGVKLGNLTIENAENLKDLDISGCSDMTNLKVENCPKLTGSIELHKLNSLENIFLTNTALERLKVTDCPVLWWISLTENNIKYVEAINCPEAGVNFLEYNLLGYNLNGIKDPNISLPIYTIESDSADISQFSNYGFDFDRVIRWVGADFDENTKTLTNITAEPVIYFYDCGSNVTNMFYLKINDSYTGHRHSYSWSTDSETHSLVCSCGNVELSDKHEICNLSCSVNTNGTIYTYYSCNICGNGIGADVSSDRVTTEMMDYLKKFCTPMDIALFVNCFTADVAEDVMILTEAQLQAIEFVLENDMAS